MMRHFLVLPALLTSSCSHQPFVVESGCAVYNFDGRITSGLINPSSEMANHFLSQLEERDRNRDYCWYQTDNNEIELTTGDFGHVFVRDGESWNYDSERTYIILRHER